MAATKKRGTTGATSEDTTTTTTTTTTTPSQGEAAATQANGSSRDGVSVDAFADGQLKSTFWTSASQQQALEAKPSEPQMMTR